MTHQGNHPPHFKNKVWRRNIKPKENRSVLECVNSGVARVYSPEESLTQASSVVDLEQGMAELSIQDQQYLDRREGTSTRDESNIPAMEISDLDEEELDLMADIFGADSDSDDGAYW